MTTSTICTDCGWIAERHACNLPELREAIGIDLTATEQRILRYVAVSIDGPDAFALAGLFRRMRGVASLTDLLQASIEHERAKREERQAHGPR